MIKFKEWLDKRIAETTTSSNVGGGTSTADIAGFARPLVFQDEDKKKTHLIRRMKKENK